MIFTNRKALITGVTSQNNENLVEFLLDKGYEEHEWRTSLFNTDALVTCIRILTKIIYALFYITAI